MDGLICHAVTSKWAKGTGGPAGDECQNLIAHALRADGYDASEDGSGRGTPLVVGTLSAQSFSGGAGGRPEGAAAGHFVPVSFSAKDHGGDADETAPTLRAGGFTGSHANGGVMPAVTQPIGVRRITPRECERLQGFADDFTKIPVRHYKRRRVTRTRPEDYWIKDLEGEGWFLCLADGPRYKLLGNSMAVPVMRWIGERIALVESIVL
jgi:DNA (cytosine-5)-methyltransferase 1